MTQLDEEKNEFHAWYASEFPLSAQAIKQGIADEECQDAYNMALVGWLGKNGWTTALKWKEKDSVTQPLEDVPFAPQTLSGFLAAYNLNERHKRFPTDQEIFDAGVRAGMCRVAPSSKELPSTEQLSEFERATLSALKYIVHCVTDCRGQMEQDRESVLSLLHNVVNPNQGKKMNNVKQYLEDIEALLEDPMWPNHVEISKDKLRLCKRYVEMLRDICECCLHNGEPEDHKEHRDLILEARRFMGETENYRDYQDSEDSEDDGPSVLNPNKPYKGVIYNWYLLPVVDNSGDYVVVGQVTGHPYASNGSPIRTSMIVKINDQLSQVETLNSCYDLVDPRSESRSARSKLTMG